MVYLTFPFRIKNPSCFCPSTLVISMFFGCVYIKTINMAYIWEPVHCCQFLLDNPSQPLDWSQAPNCCWFSGLFAAAAFPGTHSSCPSMSPDFVTARQLCCVKFLFWCHQRFVFAFWWPLYVVSELFTFMTPSPADIPDISVATVAKKPLSLVPVVSWSSLIAYSWWDTLVRHVHCVGEICRLVGSDVGETMSLSPYLLWLWDELACLVMVRPCLLQSWLQFFCRLSSFENHFLHVWLDHHWCRRSCTIWCN